MYDLSDTVTSIWAESSSRDEFIDKMSNQCDVPQDTLNAIGALLEAGALPVDAIDQCITHYEESFERMWI